MRNMYVFIGCLFCLPAFCQNTLVFKGTVKCFIENDERATRGAKNVVVVPGFVPGKSNLTGTQGYYELNTSIPAQKLEGKYVMIYFISSCKDCELKRSVFVSEDQLRPGSKNLSYLTVETVQMKAACKRTELPSLQSDRIYDSVVRVRGQDLEKISNLNAVTASPGLLNLLTTIATGVGVPNAGQGFNADTIDLVPDKIQGYGKFLFASPMNASANTGFNFSPHRDLSEAVFWNPAAIAGSYQKGGVYLFTNVKNNAKLSGFISLNDKLKIGAGVIYTAQDNFRLTRFSNQNNSVLPEHLQKLKEYAVYLSPSVRINDRFAAGLGLKAVWQDFNIPDSLFIVSRTDNRFFDQQITRRKFDVDVSFSYKVTPALSAGVNVMNIAGTKLYADAFAAGKKIVSERNLRSLGLGLCYKWKQLNAGLDVLVTEKELYDVSIGLNFIPFNNALLSGGFAFKQKSFSFSFKMKHFRVAYVHDNGLLVNEQRKGKINLLNGQLYSGLVFTF